MSESQQSAHSHTSEMLAERVLSEETALSGILLGETERRIQRMRDEGWANLDPERRAFVLSYVETGSVPLAVESMERDMAFGRKMMVDPLVRAAINDVQDVLLRETIITKAEIIRRADRLFSMALGDEESNHTTSEGIPFSAKKANLPVAKGVLEFLGKDLGMSAGGAKGGGGVTVNIDFSALDSRPPNVTIEGSTDG